MHLAGWGTVCIVKPIIDLALYGTALRCGISVSDVIGEKVELSSSLSAHKIKANSGNSPFLFGSSRSR